MMLHSKPYHSLLMDRVYKVSVIVQYILLLIFFSHFQMEFHHFYSMETVPNVYVPVNHFRRCSELSQACGSTVFHIDICFKCRASIDLTNAYNFDKKVSTIAIRNAIQFNIVVNLQIDGHQILLLNQCC